MPLHDDPVLRALHERRSIRKYTREPVDREAINTILEAGRWAPSGLNNQPWRFLVLTAEKDGRRFEALCEHTKYAHVITRAAALIVVTLEREAMYSEQKDHQGAGACVQNMLLAIHALGLGGVWLGEIVNQGPAALEAIGVDANAQELQAVIALGHPDQEGSSSRKPLDELLLEDF